MARLAMVSRFILAGGVIYAVSMCDITSVVDIAGDDGLE